MDYTTRVQRFHGHRDAELKVGRQRFVENKETKHFIIQERKVSYRIYTHFHPYVGPLTQRLLRKGVTGLQAADTEFNTRVSLTAAANARDAAGRLVALPAGALVRVPDGAIVTLAGVLVRLAGPRMLKVSDETEVAPVVNGSVVLAQQTAVRLVHGDTVRLEADSTATLTDGGPRPVLYGDIFTSTRYDPSPALVEQPYPVKDLDFTPAGAYAVYNWELFFHVPLTIAMHLSKNGRFAEAQRWFHFLFDPTDDSDGPTPERFWKVRPFQTTDVKKIEQILVNLATKDDKSLLDDTIQSINAWQDTPFRPHVVARFRQQAYMYKTVMAYLDNLIAWGDSLFRQDTGEAIDEALILYILAANILGPRPQPVPKKGSVRPQTYENLRKDLELFGVVLREAEADIGLDLEPVAAEDAGDNAQLATVRSLGKALYFCVPRNDKLLSYWDTVADRLFKIHNSLNIQGIFRQLALFEPPIDPAMLARAAAAGLDVAAIVGGLNQPLPLVRFQLLAQKAAEIVQEVKSLGANLLSAMEKEDGEAMAIMRARHERVILEMVERLRYAQLQEAIKAREGLLTSLALAVQRFTFYQLQLGRSLDEIQKAIPQLTELDKESLDKMKFSMEEPAIQLADLRVNIAPSLGESGGKIISSYEREEMVKTQQARDLNDEAATKDKIAAVLSLIPELGVDFKFWGIGGHFSFGGSALSRGMSFWGSFAKTDAEKKMHESGNSSRIGSYDRRELDWTFQSNLAAGEINQVFKQLRAAELREAIAERELANHRQQIANAKEVEQFMNEDGTDRKGKPTNKALYTWMKREVRGLYAQCFQLAFDVAKKAERALQLELGDPSLSYLQFGYQGGKEGLLAGEKLYLDLRRMELAYLELNRREYELTKHVSLLQVDPLALIQLRATGRCTVQLPEALFDMDGPGHYFRRIKSVAVSIPCVTGPYAGVNCTLTLLKSSIRKTALVGDGYAPADAEDPRFDNYYGSLQSIVTSSGQNDSGLFETNLRDERYLPFENSGVISEWQLQLPADPSKKEPAQFDYDTISDVILHIRYTAREGGGLLRKGAVDNLTMAIGAAQAVGSVRLFSLRHEFPSAWAAYKAAPVVAGIRPLSITLRPQHFPYWSKPGPDEQRAVVAAELVARATGNVAVAALDDHSVPIAAQTDNLGAFAGGLKQTALTNAPKPLFDGAWRVGLTAEGVEDAWLLVKWGAPQP